MNVTESPDDWSNKDEPPDSNINIRPLVAEKKDVLRLLHYAFKGLVQFSVTFDMLSMTI